MRHSANDTEAREGGRPEGRPKYEEELGHCGLSIEYARIVWIFHLADDTDLRAIFTLEERSAIARGACPSASAAMADAELAVRR